MDLKFGTKTIALNIIFIDSTEDMRKELNERLSQGYGPQVFQIKKMIVSLS